mgnify:CR=1 FL=1
MTVGAMLAYIRETQKCEPTFVSEIRVYTAGQYMEMDAAAEQPTEEVALASAAGRVMGDYLYLYPPGVPILVPGEVIQMKHIENIQNYLSQGLEVHGGYLKESGNVKVILHHG